MRIDCTPHKQPQQGQPAKAKTPPLPTPTLPSLPPPLFIYMKIHHRHIISFLRILPTATLSPLLFPLREPHLTPPPQDSCNLLSPLPLPLRLPPPLSPSCIHPSIHLFSLSSPQPGIYPLPPEQSTLCAAREGVPVLYASAMAMYEQG